MRQSDNAHGYSQGLLSASDSPAASVPQRRCPRLYNVAGGMRVANVDEPTGRQMCVRTPRLCLYPLVLPTAAALLPREACTHAHYHMTRSCSRVREERERRAPVRVKKRAVHPLARRTGALVTVGRTKQRAEVSDRICVIQCGD